jgi:tetratricopeptide (TPR) repeat protein
MTWNEKNPALAEAQDLMWTAFDTDSKTKRIELSQKALETCSECANAYVILSADLSFPDRQAKIRFLEEGVKAGHRALGPRYFKEEVGSFWGILETRPYMRAVCALAIQLQEDGQNDAAITHYYELLRLNPYDNQGVRYNLIPLLVSLKRLKEAGPLLKQYAGDDGVWVVYSRVLMHFKQRRGITKVARAALAEAVASNQHVIDYLLDPNFNDSLPTSGYYSPGDKSEAYCYAQDWRQDWHKTHGAIPWLIASLVDGYLKSEAPDAMLWRRRDISGQCG